MDHLELYKRITDIVEVSQSINELWGYFSLIPELPSHYYIHSYLMYCKNDLAMVINSVNKKLQDLSLESVNSKINAFHVIPSDSSIGKNYFFVIPISDLPDIFQILMVSDSHFSDLISSKLVNKIYPKAMPTFFKQNELINSINEFNKGYLFQDITLVTDMVTKGKYESPLNEQLIYTNRIWKRISFHQAIRDVKEKNEWISSIKIEWIRTKVAINTHVSLGECRINKAGEISYWGDIARINKGLVYTLAHYVRERLEKFQNRGLRERGFTPSPPLEIEYKENVFDNVTEIHRFGDVIRKYPDSTIAVLHGNPYYHASIADYLDGSSFNIWILSSRRILIKPQIKASPQALERLVSYISTDFEEGEISEYKG